MRFLLILSMVVCIFKHLKADQDLCEVGKCSADEKDFAVKFLLSQLIDVIDETEESVKYLQELNESFENRTQHVINQITKINKSVQFQKEVEHNETDLHDPMEYTKDTLQYLKDRQLVEQSIDILDFNSSVLTRHSDDAKSWKVIQRRQDGSVDFNRNWEDYKKGFGKPDGEFFVSLDKIHNLTNEDPLELVVILEDFHGTMKYAVYDSFMLGSEMENYQLKSLGNYQGNAGDYLSQHLNMYFSTKDRDNDMTPEGSCAEWFKGAWWYYYCMSSNLNGPYRNSPYLFGKLRGEGITWGNFYEIQYAYKFSQMMMRLKD